MKLTISYMKILLHNNTIKVLDFLFLPFFLSLLFGVNFYALSCN